MPHRLPSPPEPFVLIDDARPVNGAAARLYRDPVEVVTAAALGQVIPALDRLRDGVRRGLHAAGYLHYEAGFAFDPAFAGLADRAGGADGPLLWFGLFEGCTTLAARDVPALLPAPRLAPDAPLRPRIGEGEHGVLVRRVLDLIDAGDIYQANLTLPAAVPLGADLLAAYAAIRPHAAMAHGALVRHDGRHILSFSPESFFALADGVVETRPMKGTAPRRADPRADAAEAGALRTDPKQRAENLMIVDLLRNDLSRVCAAGSVTVPSLFAVESYPTVHQMVSRVSGRLMPGLDAIDVLKALFPCGSVTGAPKIRAMEVIGALEPWPRGIYTGAIGAIGPDGDAAFNVAIRTISVNKGADSGTMGIGSGIVADSRAPLEWAECLAKAAFVERARQARTGDGF